MKVIEFYRFYYNKSHKSFVDDINPSTRGIHISKKNRKSYLIFAYITLSLCLLTISLIFLFKELWLMILMFCFGLIFLDFMIIVEADFNIISH